MMKFVWIALGLVALHWVRMLAVGLWQSEKVWENKTLNTEEEQETLRHLLRSFLDITRDADIHWWIAFGTLLAAWRQQDLQPWDHDADICYLVEDRAKLEALVPQFAARGLDMNMERNVLRVRGRAEPYVDVDPVMLHEGRRCVGHPARRTGIHRYWLAWFDDQPDAWVRQPRWSIRLIGRWFPCPAQPERMLKFHYPSLHVHMRLVLADRLRCWFSLDYYREAWRTMRSRQGPVLRRTWPPDDLP